MAITPATNAPNVTSIAASPAPSRLSVPNAQPPLIAIPKPQTKAPAIETNEMDNTLVGAWPPGMA